MQKPYKTIVSTFSLKANEVGKSVGSETIVEHSSGEGALRHLKDAFVKHPRVKDTAFRFMIETPDGRRVPFDAAYSEIFGVSPVYQDNKETRYPLL